MKILLIEDDAIEILKFQRSISSLGLNHDIVEVRNGEEALRVLKFKDKLPDIILLDLNMPRINGIDFLRILKNDNILKFIPTIVLTTSRNGQDIFECYKIGISGYVLKPLKYEDYFSRIKAVMAYWSVNELCKAY